MTASFDLFADSPEEQRVALGPQAVVLRQKASPLAAELVARIEDVLQHSPLYQMATPGGKPLSVRTTSCGTHGWSSDPTGYSYVRHHPLTDQAWPEIPAAWSALATEAAQEAGFAQFAPDTCLINQYGLDSKMALHQDRSEQDLRQPVVSISLGMSALFLWGGMQRSDKPAHVLLHHGDMVVWGGVDRLRFHGIKHLTGAPHPQLGAMRYNLTLRRAR
ncbi:DNA oxidative demethylase AlkB [Lampropedia aestuarii]|uniref:DNA oxidative demethylase AlkB n=1 Tax=Lampropedia aestuarii TaxID=2562762 RepID=A0A4S5BF56_9BURK|nr:DNA oxidative demethylase AlkB [Lampropedia aestuarii]THJ30850.1 DNA oxidative demethylase AlkB [Lampropedia aestuarii]